jgi:coatomer subunit beta'
LYNGKVHIYNYDTQVLLRTFDITDVPVRAGRFIARKNWIVTGSDDFQLVFLPPLIPLSSKLINLCTESLQLQHAREDYKLRSSSRVITLHFPTPFPRVILTPYSSYIRCIAIHPTQSFVLTGSDDMTIKLWNWDQEWKCTRVFEGHAHYVMSLAVNPKDPNTFASSCLDRTVKVWSFTSSTANYTLEAHDKGVNHVDYYHAADKPYLITTGDDKYVKLWDYQTKACIQTLEGHTSNVSFACFHPTQPIIVSGSEDGTVKIWHANTYRLEQTLNYGLERAWCCTYLRGRQEIGMGFDEGVVVIKMGREEPAVSMDGTGKIVWAKYSDIETAMIKPAGTNLFT